MDKEADFGMGKEVAFGLGMTKHEFEVGLWLSSAKRLGESNIYPVHGRAFLDDFGKELCAGIEAKFLSNFVRSDEERIDTGPADWWEHFKERWFPAWWLAKHPVKRSSVVVSVTHYRTCPHIQVQGNNRPHVEWMVGNDAVQPLP